AMRSALSTACSIARVVPSRSTTTPFRTPTDKEVPIPVMWTSLSWSGSATTTQTLVVPISSPTRGPRFAKQVHLRVRLGERWTVQRGLYSTCRILLLPPGGRGAGSAERPHDNVAGDAQVHRLDHEPARGDRLEYVRNHFQALVDAGIHAQPHRDSPAEREVGLTRAVDVHDGDSSAEGGWQRAGDP